MARRALFIVNPTAAAGRGARDLDRIRPLLRGTHVRHKRASYSTGRDLEVRTASEAEVQLDGDCVGMTPARFRVLPGALRLIVAG